MAARPGILTMPHIQQLMQKKKKEGDGGRGGKEEGRKEGGKEGKKGEKKKGRGHVL